MDLSMLAHRIGALEDQLHKAMVLNGDGKQFISRHELPRVVTDEVIEACIPNRELSLFIRTEARKLFAIVILSLHEGPERTCWMLMQFKDTGFTDSLLPVDEKYAKESRHARQWSANTSTQPAEASGAFADWKYARICEFCTKQWLFLAPVFSRKQFVHHLHPNHVLPFLEKRDITGKGHFGDVREAHLHVDHQEGFQLDSQDTTYRVAIKEYTNHGPGSDIARQAWLQETQVYERIGKRHHPHLIERVAAIEQNNLHYLILAWADGGDLRHFWHAHRTPSLNASLVSQVLKQIEGLASALCSLHDDPNVNSVFVETTVSSNNPATPAINVTGAADGLHEKSNTRHGDMKPENILIFTDKTDLGTLRIADLGLAKVHTQPTAHRRLPSSATHGTAQYEAPEVKTMQSLPRSRLYDIWSFGCILLEMTIWMLYGFDELTKFWATEIQPATQTLFYTINSASNDAQVSGVASAWMQHILKHNPQCNQTHGTALRDLLQLVRDGLLVVAIPRNSSAKPPFRMDATTICRKLGEIRLMAQKDPSYLFTEGEQASPLPSAAHSTRKHQAAAPNFLSPDVRRPLRSGPPSQESSKDAALTRSPAYTQQV